jgi:hypothetical protein
MLGRRNKNIPLPEKVNPRGPSLKPYVFCIISASVVRIIYDMP